MVILVRHWVHTSAILVCGTTIIVFFCLIVFFISRTINVSSGVKLKVFWKFSIFFLYFGHVCSRVFNKSYVRHIDCRWHVKATHLLLKQMLNLTRHLQSICRTKISLTTRVFASQLLSYGIWKGICVTSMSASNVCMLFRQSHHLQSESLRFHQLRYTGFQPPPPPLSFPTRPLPLTITLILTITDCQINTIPHTADDNDNGVSK